MTRDDIIRMAREAGIDAESDTLCRYEGWVEPFERFAALVAAAEREACAKVCEDMEAGAEFTDCCKWPTPIDCAAAIRARSKA